MKNKIKYNNNLRNLSSQIRNPKSNISKFKHKQERDTIFMNHESHIHLYHSLSLFP